MSNIDILESRITGALDRIRRGLDALPVQEATPQSGEDAAALREKLEEERVVTAQLEERVRALKERQDGKMTTLETRIEAQRTQMAELDKELQRLRQSNADMREINAQLRSAASEGSASPELINRAMMAEIEALSAQRASEAAEVDAIISELKPLIVEAKDATG